MRDPRVVLLLPAVILLPVLLAACASHYGVALELQAPQHIEDTDIERAQALLSALATRYGMKRAESTKIPSTRSELLVFFSGPYPPDPKYSHDRAGGLELSLWLRTDRSSLSVWIVDWRGVGLTDRLQNFRDETKAALEADFPGYAVRIKAQKLGTFPP